MIELLCTLTLLTFSDSDKKLCALREVLSIIHKTGPPVQMEKKVSAKKRIVSYLNLSKTSSKKNPHRFNLEKKFMMRIDRYMNQIYQNLPL